MDASRLISILEGFPEVLRTLVLGLSDTQVRYKPETGGWSVLEVVCHLADEEVEDFRPRVLGTLRDPVQAWVPIDPEGVAVARDYNGQDLQTQLARFCAGRSDSVQQLRALKNPDWSLAYRHPKFGPIRAGDILVSWAAHDILHLRQIAKRIYDLITKAGGEFSTAYAGDW